MTIFCAKTPSELNEIDLIIREYEILLNALIIIMTLIMD